MSIIAALQTYIKTYSGLANTNVLIDKVGPDTVEYGIVPIPGPRILEMDINGGSVREYPFALVSSVMTADDATRLDNSEFCEEFSDWLETQTLAGTLPTLGAKQTATSIEATLGGAQYAEGESGTAIYQIQCKLTYEQQP